MGGNSGHVDRDVKELSYRDYIKARVANAVVLAREMEKAIGTENAQTSHPRIKLRRSLTIMEGHECCDHIWYWDADEEP